MAKIQTRRSISCSKEFYNFIKLHDKKNNMCAFMEHAVREYIKLGEVIPTSKEEKNKQYGTIQIANYVVNVDINLHAKNKEHAEQKVQAMFPVTNNILILDVEEI